MTNYKKYINDLKEQNLKLALNVNNQKYLNEFYLDFLEEIKYGCLLEVNDFLADKKELNVEEKGFLDRCYKSLFFTAIIRFLQTEGRYGDNIQFVDLDKVHEANLRLFYLDKINLNIGVRFDNASFSMSLIVLNDDQIQKDDIVVGFIDYIIAMSKSPDDVLDLVQEMFDTVSSVKRVIEAMNEEAELEGSNEDDQNESISLDVEEQKEKQQIVMSERFKKLANLSAGVSFATDDKLVPAEKKIISFKWNDAALKIEFPFQVADYVNNQEKLESLHIIENLEWFNEQNDGFKKLFIGLWVFYVSLKAIKPEDDVSLNWKDFNSYLLAYMKSGLKMNTKDLVAKIKSVERIAEVTRFIDGGFIDSEMPTSEDVLKVFLLTGGMAARQSGKSYLINVEDIGEESYYSINLETNGLMIWNYVLFGKLEKEQMRKIDLQKFSELKEKFPNFSEVIDYYAGAFYIYNKTGAVPSPVLLLGDPGLGKTYLTQELSNLLNTMSVLVPVSSLSAGWVLSGSAPQWKDAEMGKVAKNLMIGKTKNPVFILDEIDKKNASNFDPLGSLYPLLETKTAKTFTDEYFGFPIDASGVIWVATANKLVDIPEPILDRFVQFEIRKLTEEETSFVVKSIWDELTAGLDVQPLSEKVIKELSVKSPRQIRQVLKLSLASAAKRHDDNIVIKSEHLKTTQITKKFGFGN